MKSSKITLISTFAAILLASACSDDSSSNSTITCGTNEVPSGNACVCDNAHNYYGTPGDCKLCSGENKTIMKDKNMEYCLCKPGFEENSNGVCKSKCDEHEIPNTSGACVCDNSANYYGDRGSCAFCNGEHKVVKDNKCVCDTNFENDGAGGCKEKSACSEHEIESGGSCVCDNESGYYGESGSCALCDGTGKIVKDNNCVCDKNNNYIANGTDCVIEKCEPDTTKCGEAEKANILYTCTSDEIYDSGLDCSEQINKTCGDTLTAGLNGWIKVKGCTCDASKHYTESNDGSCVCEPNWTADSDACICDASKHRFVRMDDPTYPYGNCMCDYANHWVQKDYNDNTTDCMCDPGNGYTYDENTDACVCDTNGNWVNNGNKCKCDGTVDGTYYKYCYKTFGKIEVGSKVTFGNYYQSNDTTKEPISWIVLEVDHDEHAALLISEHVIWYGRQISIHSGGWEDSHYRRYLHDEFINEAFSTTEQELIVTRTNRSVNSSGRTEITNDKVFMLSTTECEENEYLKNQNNRKAKITAYLAKTHGETPFEKCGNLECDAEWALRSPVYLEKFSTGDTNAHFPCVIEDGSIKEDDHTKSCHWRFVRPAIWVHY